MYTVYILWAMGIFIFVMLLIHWTKGKEWKEFLSAIFLTVALIGSPLMAFVVGYNNVPRATVVERTNLVCLKDNSSISGSAFLFGGAVNSNPAYYYYEEADGGMILKSLPAKGIRVYEDTSSGVGYLEVVESRVVSPSNYLHWSLWVGSYIESRSFHVPPGSISRNFILDAE